MPINNRPFGYFRGTSLIQKSGEASDTRNVFVNLVGNHNDYVYPHIGGVVMNPPKGPTKMWAGDLLEYRTSGSSTALQPEIYILRTFKVVSASGTTVNVVRDKFSHKPFVGDILMKAPAVIGGTGTGVSVTAVTATTVTVNSVTYDVYALTTSANIASSLSKDDILVEAEATGANKKMLVQNINGIFDCDTDFMFDENIAGVNATRTSGDVTSVTDADFYKARYQYTPSLGGLMWIDKMSPMPQCVLDLNLSNVNGWFHVNYALNGKKIATALALETRIAALEAGS